MKLKQTIERLGKWIKVIQKSILVLAGIEAVIVIIIGIASSNLYHENYSKFWLGILVFLGVLYLLITIIKIAYNNSFPSSIVEELTAKSDLENANSSIVRKDAINSYISNTILDLSKCKCNIPKQNKEDDWKEISDNDFFSGIKSIMTTFNSVLNILLNTSNIKFSTGVYVDYFRGVNHENKPQRNNGTFLTRDDFEFYKLNSIRNIMSDNDITAIGLEIQNALKVSFNNGVYHAYDLYSNDEKKAIIICSNIQNLKNTKEQKGVLFIVTKPIEQLPEDIESVLRMFANIISHWLDLYEHEVLRRQLDNEFSKNEDNQNN